MAAQDLASTSGPRPEPPASGFWGDALQALLRDGVALFGLGLVAALLLAAALAPFIAPYSPTRQLADGLTMMGDPVAPGTPGFVLGADGLGRDMLSRVLHGATVSLAVGIGANAFAAIMGFLIGGIAGLAGGRISAVLMRSADVIVSFPVLLLAMTVLAVIASPGIVALSTVIGVNFAGYLARIVHSQVVSLATRDFVIAARAAGAGTPYLLVRHILPHVLPSILVFCSLGMSSAIQLEAALSYVGLGIQPPTPSWGNMIAEGQPFLFTAPWMVLVPGCVLFAGIVGFSLFGDGMRDVLDPTLDREAAGK